jgi:hypothetical protein
MIAEKTFLHLVDRSSGAALAEPAPIRPSRGETGHSSLKPKDLIGLLLAHGARTRRHARPRCRIYLDVFTPSGIPAVEIGFD